MPGAPSEQVLPKTVNPLKFALQDTSLEGRIATGSLNRLDSALAVAHDTIDVALRFYLNDFGKAVVAGKASGEVILICQRCLEPVTQVIDIEISLALVRNDEQIKALRDCYDPWMVNSEDGSADLYSQLEDELLLALPMVAFHSDLCIDSALLNSGDDQESEQESTNPFSVLEQLKIKTPKTD